MVAQMERRFIKARQHEGIAGAKADGVYRGGKLVGREFLFSGTVLAPDNAPGL